MRYPYSDINKAAGGSGDGEGSTPSHATESQRQGADMNYTYNPAPTPLKVGTRVQDRFGTKGTITHITGNEPTLYLVEFDDGTNTRLASQFLDPATN